MEDEKIWPITKKDTQRIIEVESGFFDVPGLEYRILKDRRTGKEYLVLLSFKAGIAVSEVQSSYETTIDGVLVK